MRHPRVPGSLGRVLSPDGAPAGTCFQVAPGIVVTAWHVLAGLGCGYPSAQVRTDALGGGAAAEWAKVTAVDDVRDLAVLRRARPLEESVPGWAPTDAVRLLTGVVVNGVAGVDDPGHDYRFLHATGSWQGWTVRDGVPLGRLSSSALLPGMSGAPVLRLTDGVVLGVVSARYNSADGWLRDSVWVARTEDLTHLLEGPAEITVHSRLTLGDEPGTLISAHDATPAPRATVTGAAEAAREAALVLTAIDDTCRGDGPLQDLLGQILERAAVGSWSRRETDEFRRRLRLRGLEPRVLLPRLADHDEALHRWSAPLPGREPADEMAAHAARALLGSVRRVLADKLPGGMFTELSDTCRSCLREALLDGDGIPLSGFLHALLDLLPPIRSASVEAVLVPPRPPATGDTDSVPAVPGPAPGRAELAAVAVQMCRLPAPDPCVAGREELVARLARAIDRRMTRYGSATAFLSGQPGAGTSTVAVESARALTPAFPGGVYYVDLRGLMPEARLNARTVVRIISEALRLDLGSELTDDARQLAALTAALHERRVLLVLDNAADAAHVRPFVKAPVGCALIVTSRDRTQDYADPGLVLDVGPLSRPASVAVLIRCCQERPDACEPAALDRVAQLCGDVPLALRIAGARLAHPSGPPASYLVQLLEEESVRLDALAYGDRAVRLAIRLSHDALDPPAQRVFRLIAAAPGAAVNGAELGHCLKAPAMRQELLLNRLVDRSLARQDLVRLPAGALLATFRLYDLVLLYAREQLDLTEPPAEIQEFQRAGVAYLVNRLAEITDQRYGAQLIGELDPSRFHAALSLAEQNGWLEMATELMIGLHVLYSARGELDAVVDVNDDRIALHLRRGDPEEAVKTCLLNADTLRSGQALKAAVAAARKAVGLAREHRLPVRVAEAEFKLSMLLWEAEDWTGALSAGERAVDTLTTTGRAAAAVPVAINNFRIARRACNTDKALRWGRKSVELADRWGSSEHRAMACNECGVAEEDAGNLQQALGLYRRGAALWEQAEEPWNTANCNTNAARTAALLDDPTTAVHLYQVAADWWERGNDRPRVLETLIDLSAVYAAEDAHQQAVNVLARAERLALGDASDAPAMLCAEVLIRHAAARLFADDPAAGAEGDAPDTTEDEELDRIRTILAHRRSGTLTMHQAREETRSLLTTRTRNQAPRNTPWIYEALAADPAMRTALDG
ncbi:trypsin-like peptidase domain-containing protein [Streptomyces sp. NPDC096311]|uniref:trypsin-like peptidase domain-containing protein n=1 Tax=Streptomyces sp. NPDC096311 TaxID=3366083 RepID=UPI0038282BDC